VRALRGALLRREVYGLDGTEAEARPYVVEAHGYEVRLFHATSGEAKRARDATPGVTFRFEREVRHAAHERVEAGPRIVQHLTLAVDTWGTTTREAVVAYPRPSATEPAQQALLVAVPAGPSCSQSSASDAVGAARMAAACTWS
jgi:hypothetical protein